MCILLSAPSPHEISMRFNDPMHVKEHLEALPDEFFLS